MDRKTIEQAVKKEPFEPFRVVTSSGQAYDVLHPEAVMLLPTKVVIAVPSDGPGSALDSVAICSLLHVSSIESPIQPPR